MAQLDRFLSAMAEYQAESLVLETGAPVSFQTQGVSRPVTQQKLEAEQITALIAELTDSSVVEDSRRSGGARYEYGFSGQRFEGELRRTGDKIVAHLRAAPEVAVDASGPVIPVRRRRRSLWLRKAPLREPRPSNLYQVWPLRLLTGRRPARESICGPTESIPVPM